MMRQTGVKKKQASSGPMGASDRRTDADRTDTATNSVNFTVLLKEIQQT